jgi:uncharacterized membrane protein YphA (DoxX/SURF4 family)
MDSVNMGALARAAVTCVTFAACFPASISTTSDLMRLPGEILQGILARAALVLLRVYLGLAFLLQGVQLLRSSVHAVPGVVLPNEHIFWLLFSWGELLAGGFLILGWLTRLWAAAALLFSLTYLLAREGGIDTAFGARGLSAAISLALLIGAAGRTLGVDSWFARRWPRSPLW